MCRTARSARPTCCSALQCRKAGNAEAAAAGERALRPQLKADALPGQPARVQVRPIQSGGKNAEGGGHEDDDDGIHGHG
jgi:hypothetical protein